MLIISHWKNIEKSMNKIYFADNRIHFKKLLIKYSANYNKYTTKL